MFTGIVEGMGSVKAVFARGEKGRLTIHLGELADGVRIGDSIAADGACLTVTDIADAIAAFDVSGETLRRTTLGDRRPNDRVNLERALKVGDRLGGHFVQGHVDAVGVLAGKAVEPGQWTLEFTVPSDLASVMIPKGSVAVDGVSLTLANLQRDRFSVALIPHTIQATTLKDKIVGDRVNVEGDMIGKYVARLLGATGTEGISKNFLGNHGFLG